MIKHLSGKIGQMTLDNLISNVVPQTLIAGGIIAGLDEEKTYPRGTLFGEDTATGRLYLYGVSKGAQYILTASGLTFSLEPSANSNFRIQFGSNAEASVNVSIGSAVPTTDAGFAALLADTSFTLGEKTYTAAVNGDVITYTADSIGAADAIEPEVFVFWIDSEGDEHSIDIYGYTAAFIQGADASKLVPSCILTDDTPIGTDDTPVTVYTGGSFNPDALTVSDGYEITPTDKDKLRMRGIVLAKILA
jgi:hypothetical protein